MRGGAVSLQMEQSEKAVGGPAEEVVVEGDGGGLVGGGDFNSAEATEDVAFDVWHSWRKKRLSVQLRENQTTVDFVERRCRGQVCRYLITNKL